MKDGKTSQAEFFCPLTTPPQHACAHAEAFGSESKLILPFGISVEMGDYG